jgi:hypothetical protein
VKVKNPKASAKREAEEDVEEVIERLRMSAFGTKRTSQLC